MLRNDPDLGMRFQDYEEEIMEALKRLDLDVEDTTDAESLREALKEQLGYEPSEAQMDWFSEGALDIAPRLEEYGIYPISFIRYGYQEVRYVITGSRGLWGWEAVQEYIQSLLSPF
jgi:hypothetical protein